MSREKKESLISITHVVQGYEHIYRSQNSIKENGN